jgi:hypothetical protein
MGRRPWLAADAAPTAPPSVHLVQAVHEMMRCLHPWMERTAGMGVEISGRSGWPLISMEGIGRRRRPGTPPPSFVSFRGRGTAPRRTVPIANRYTGWR